jgi:hypothetical protein
MRQDCKHFESRTYRNGETVRKCDLDLAPEAPWRCPADCPRYERRMADVNWSYGTLVTPRTPDEPLDALERDDGSVARLLDEAEEIINSVGPTVVAEVEAETRRGRGEPRWKRWRRRRLPRLDGGSGRPRGGGTPSLAIRSRSSRSRR